MITGVGGQGNLVTSKVLAHAAISEGVSPTIGQTFGASQRGGAVVTHIRLAEEQIAPLIPKGRLNVLIGLEPLEALRAAIEFAGTKTYTIVSNLRIDTLDTLMGKTKYPHLNDIFESLVELCGTVYRIPAQERGIEIHSISAYIMGVVAALDVLPIKRESVRQGYESIGKRIEENLIAFNLGVSDASDLQAFLE